MLRQKREIFFFVFILVICLSSVCFAGQETARYYINSRQYSYLNLINHNKRIRISAAFNYGSGSLKSDGGGFEANSDYNIGGGYGGTITIGYILSRNFDVDLTLGHKEGRLLAFEGEDKRNHGEFKKNIVEASLKYKMLLSKDSIAKIGVGVGAYLNGIIDYYCYFNRNYHNTLYYSDTIGFHITGEYEVFFMDSFSAIIGAKYYHVNYKLRSYTVLNIDNIEEKEVAEEYQNVDGSGLDFILAVSKYF